MKSKAGIICMVLGIVLLTAALSLFSGNRSEARSAEESVDKLLPELLNAIEERPEEELPDPYDPEMTVVEIDGYGYIGYLSIPLLELELPVMEKWNYERLKIAPCRYFGSTKTNNLVIAAHNYERHFGKISDLQAGAEVLFTDMDGVVTLYEVAVVEVLNPEAIGEMTSGDYDLTLFTCTYGGQSRVTVHCIRIN